MGEGTKIEWAHHTFNPWWGCQRVSPGCEKCYAESFSNRYGFKIWGPESTGTPRRFFGDKHWAEPLRWNKRAAERGVRERVFCASMADVFEDRDDLVEHRHKLSHLIAATPSLDWLLLTKRPENVRALWCDPGTRNIWLGCTAEDQKRADERIPHLLACRDLASVLFVSYEPALELVDFKMPPRALVTMSYVHPEYGAKTGLKVGDTVEHRSAIDWIIVGGESGPGARPFDLAWARSTIEQCRAAGVACHVKQLGNNPVGDWSDAEQWPEQLTSKAAIMSEWPEDLRVREYPR